PTESTIPRLSCPSTRKLDPGGQAPYLASLISRSVPSRPRLRTRTTTPRPPGTSSRRGSGRSSRWMLPAFPGLTATAFILNRLPGRRGSLRPDPVGDARHQLQLPPHGVGVDLVPVPR